MTPAVLRGHGIMNSKSEPQSKALLALEASRDITPAGKDWVTQTLDPFHDWQARPVGFPDTTVGSSLIQTINLTQTVNIVDDVHTDVHVFTLPQLGIREMWQQPMLTPTVYSGTNLPILYGSVGPVNIVVQAAGQGTLPYYDPTLSTWRLVPTPTVIPFDFSPFLVGDNRLVSFGVEIHNTTPELLKGGACVFYKAPQALTDSALYTQPLPPTSVLNFVPIVRSSMPPALSGAALLLSGSQQWEAYDGGMGVNTLQAVSNPIGVSNYYDQIYEPQFTNPDTGGNVGIILAPRTGSLFPQTIASVQAAPWNTIGAYFNGLPIGTRLTVIVKAYIECFPTPDQLAYTTLTSPSAAYDPVAIELYSRASVSLKPWTKVRNNEDGDHWKNVVGVLNRVAPRLGRIAGTVGRVGSFARKAKDATSADDLARMMSETKIFGRDKGSRTPRAPRPLAPNEIQPQTDSQAPSAKRRRRRLARAAKAIAAGGAV